MPLYEYECDACGHRFEVIQKFADPPLDRCPKCGGRVHKMQSAPAFQFKGSGWYITDYAKKGELSESKSDAAAKSDAAGEKKDPGGDKKDPGGDKKEPAAPKADKPAEKAAATTETKST